MLLSIEEVDQRGERGGILPVGLAAVHPAGMDEQSELDEQRREKAKLPQDIHHAERWRQAPDHHLRAPPT
jgi:hypothetical protein